MADQAQRTLGIIGGMSWESTESYYRIINEGIKAKLGGLHSADLLIHSVDFGPINTLQEPLFTNIHVINLNYFF